MRPYLLIVLLCFSTSLHSQDSLKVIDTKNDISFECGLWHRGLAGVSYTRNYGIRKLSFWSSTVAVGFGPTWSTINSYYTLNTSFNLGKENVFFVLGLEMKYVNYTIDELAILSNPIIDQYECLTASPVLGMKYIGHKGVVFEFRLAALPLFRGLDVDRIRPSAGLKIGYAF